MTETMLIERGPLDEGARVVTDVQVNEHDESFGGPCDVVTVLVPAGDGAAVENAIRRMLRVEAP